MTTTSTRADPGTVSRAKRSVAEWAPPPTPCGACTRIRRDQRMPRTPRLTLAVHSRVARSTGCSHAAPQWGVPPSAAVHRTSPSKAWSNGGSIFRRVGCEMIAKVRRATSAMTHWAPAPSTVFWAYHIPPLAGDSGKITKFAPSSGGAFSSTYGSARNAESVSTCSKLTPAASSSAAA